LPFLDLKAEIMKPMPQILPAAACPSPSLMLASSVKQRLFVEMSLGFMIQ